jgi:predicted O-methyltransferase YrrM
VSAAAPRGRQSWRGRLRRARLGLPTVLGLRRLGFFAPCRYAWQLPGPGERAPYEPLESLFAAHADSFRRFIAGWAAYAQSFAGFAAAPGPRWTQDWFPRLDGAAAYAMVRTTRPRRIVEIGSGHSTRFMAQAVADGGLATELTAIDPEPRAGLAGLAVRHIAATVPGVGLEPFRALGPGDVLFIDSSHILMPGSDVDFLFNRILPVMPAGLRVHIHDVFLPDDYPASWDWRGYNEQLGVAALLAGGGFEPVFASHYAATRLADAVAASAVARIPLAAGAHESSLWLCKTGLTAPSPEDERRG